MDNQLRRLIAQRERATQEHGNLAAADVAATLGDIERSETEALAALETVRARMTDFVASLQSERGRERELAEASRFARRELQDVEGRIVSLEALQRAALGQSQGKVVDWLKSRGLDERPRLARQLSVDAGWERAVETVLGSYLEAV
jgi:chromosome segregation protein